MKKKIEYLKKITVFLSVCFIYTGCATIYEVAKPKMDPPTAFLPDPGRMEEMPATSPFRKIWFNRKIEWKKYRKIYVAPVSTKYMLDDKWWDNINTSKATDLKKEFKVIAEYMRNSFRESIENDPLKRYQLADAPGSDTIVIELAIVELVPTRAFFNAIETVAGFIIPPVSLLTLLNAGHVAMEAKMLDGSSKKIIALLADKEKDQGALIDIAGMTWWGHSRLIIDNWSKQYVKIMTNDQYKHLRDRSPFTLFTW